jgi:hypothetical protein
VITNMKRTFLLSTLACSTALAGCAGTLTTDEQDRLWLEHTGGTGGSTGGTSATTTSGTGGSGGPMVDMCVVSTATTGPMHTCQQVGCHGGATVSAGLNLENDSLTKNFKAKYFDVPNVGDPNGMPPTPCTGGMAKLIDPANAMNSFIYQKLVATGDTTAQPCGYKMPEVGTITQQEKACILSWINSVITASK